MNLLYQRSFLFYFNQLLIMASASKLFKILILGAPASGKGTISSRILKNFDLAYISSGDQLRWNIKNNTELGKQAKTYIDAGKLVPDDFMVNFIAHEIKKIGAKNWLLDGFPRTIAQAEALTKVETIDLAINLNVPFDVIIDRVKGRWIHVPSGRVYNNDFNAPKVPGKDDVTGEDLIQRDDDKPEVVRKRLEEYDRMTRPVVEFYKKQGVLDEFTGRTSDEIWPSVLKCIRSYIPVIQQEKVRNV